MKSKRNLTRFTYETTAFQGWRLCLSRAGTTFTKYFSDKKYGGSKKSLAVAEKTLGELLRTRRQFPPRQREAEPIDDQKSQETAFIRLIPGSVGL